MARQLTVNQPNAGSIPALPAILLIFACGATPDYTTKQGLDVYLNGMPAPTGGFEAYDIAQRLLLEELVARWPATYNLKKVQTYQKEHWQWWSITLEAKAFDCPGVSATNVCAGLTSPGVEEIRYVAQAHCLSGTSFIHEMIHYYMLIGTGNVDPGHTNRIIWEDVHNLIVQKLCEQTCGDLCRHD